ncbi:MAG: AraC family transcriptional regulator [Candidatus Dactylopiibacterium carminicum]|nr:MAG: AraC family transcriptional regulator [Candidatus Dactylopiibacterium carminicum]
MNATPSPAAFSPGMLLRRTRASDADEHAHNLSQWDQRYDQLSAGSFEGCVTELWLPCTQVFVERANRRLRQTCAAWKDSVWFGIPAAEEGSMMLGHKRIPEAAVCIRDGGAEFDLITAPDFDLYGVVVDRATFASYLETHHRTALDQAIQQRDVIVLPPLQKAGLCAALATILDDARDLSQDSPAGLQERIFAQLARLLQQGQGSQPARRSQLTHQQVVSRLHAQVLQDPACVPTIPELCERLHLSRRALQNCVEEITGLSPLAYMRNIRLNAVRRELRRGDPCTPISSIAYAWGFGHLSQFAQDYRQQFGELPSATRRSA